MTGLARAFARAKDAGRAALVVFVEAGDPDLATTRRLLPALAEAGADVIELGIPFSDPLADGPTIQRASERALASGVTDPRTGTTVTSGIPTRTDYGFAWAAMAGVSYAVGSHALLDIGYRYLDLGHTTVSLFPSATVTRDLSTQEVRIGVRYMID